MKKGYLSPMIKAYSSSLLGFIRFLRDRLPLVSGDGALSPLDSLEEDPRT